MNKNYFSIILDYLGKLSIAFALIIPITRYLSNSFYSNPLFTLITSILFIATGLVLILVAKRLKKI